VYSEDPADWVDGAFCDRLAACYEKLETERQDERNEAENRYIPSPIRADVDLPSFTNNPLDEDNPDLHSRLQALTRLTEPSVTCVCLFGDRGDAYIDASRTKPVDFEKKPDVQLTRQLLNRSLTVADKSLFRILCSNIDIPAAWRKNVILRNVRPIFLDTNFKARIGEVSLLCDPEFGLQILGYE
jgi:hypothetical protein